MAEQFGHYRLDSLIGAGGMGEVYQAFDLRKRRAVAIKRLHRHLATDKEYRARFMREAELTARLDEPHVIPIYDYGEINGQLFIEMRLVRGENLATLLSRTGPLPLPQAVDILSQVADALDAAHAEGLVHRDVKPLNVLLRSAGPVERAFVYLVDFGIAQSVSGPGSTRLTATGAAVGTIAYMSPERFLGREGDGRVDVYALACLLYELLANRPPFAAVELAPLMYHHLNSPPPRVTEIRRELPVALDLVILRET